MIPASPNLAQIAVGQPQTPVPIANELAYIEANALNAGSATGDSMNGPLTVPSLKVGGVVFSVTNLMYYGTDVGTVNALKVNNSTFPVPFAGMILAVKVLNTNTGSATLSINGGSPYTIYQNDEALTGKELIVNNWVLFGFDGSFWNVIGMAPGGNPNVNQQMYAFPPGTQMLFVQSTVPPGWTQVTSLLNDALLRVVSGTGGGSHSANGVSSVLWGNATSDGTSIDVSMLPPHSHGVNDPGHNHSYNCSAWNEHDGGSTDYYYSTAGSNTPQQSVNGSATGISIQNTGGGAAHSHTLSSLNVNTLDVIVGVKS